MELLADRAGPGQRGENLVSAAFSQEPFSREQRRRIAAISCDVKKAVTAEEILTRILDGVARLISFDYGDFLLLDSLGEGLENVAYKLSGKPATFGYRDQGPRWLPLDLGLTVWVIKAGVPVLVSDVSKDDRYLSVCPDTRSELAAPLIRNGEVIGVLNLEARGVNHFDSWHQKLLVKVLAGLGDAVGRARDAELERSHKLALTVRFGVLEEIDRSIMDCATEASFLDNVAQQMVRLFPEYEMCTVWQKDADRSKLHLMGTGLSPEIGLVPNNVHRTIPLEGSISGKVVTENRFLQVRGLQRHDLFVRKELARQLSLEGMLSVPIPNVGTGGAIGCINVYTRERLHFFRREDTRLLQQIARSVAVAYARLQAEQELSAYAETAGLCQERPASRETLDQVAEMAARKTEAHGCSIFLWDGSLLRLRGTTGRESGFDYGEVSYALGEGMTGWVGENETAVRILDKSSPEEIESFEGMTPRHKYQEASTTVDALKQSFLGVPIYSNNRLAGVIRVVEKERHLPFTLLDQRILEAIARQLGIALAANVDRLHLLRQRFVGLFDLCGQMRLRGDQRTILRMIVQAAKEAIDSDTASVALYDSSDHRLHFRVYLPHQWEGQALATSRSAVAEESLVGQVYHYQSSVNCANMRAEGSIARPIHPKSRASIVVPLTVAGEKLGILACDRFEIAGFDEDDLVTLECFARVAAAFIVLGRSLKQNEDQMADLGHQLVSPISAMQSHCYRLMPVDTGADDWRAKSLRTIQTQCELAVRMARMFSVGQKLLTGGKIELRCRPLRLAQVIIRVAALYYPAARDKRKSLHVSSDALDALPQIQADEELLPQVFINLLDNAIKYSLRDSEIRVFLHAADKASCTLCVQNVGIPIHDDEREAIFRRGFRSAFAEYREPAGTGIGLPIAREIVRLHGGNMWVDSRRRPGDGEAADSRFFVRLPYAGAPQKGER